MILPIEPIELTAGTITHIEILDPNRPHMQPDERGCPDCEQPAYDSGCEAAGCTGWGCPDCGTGCDLDFASAEDGGRCARAQEDEDGEGDVVA